MEKLKFDLTKEYGTFKVLNATNGGRGTDVTQTTS